MKLFCTLFCILFTCSLFGQNVGPFRNPSFEAPFFPDWKACEYSESSPDVQPGIGSVTIAPFHGINYMGMVTRGGFGRTSRESVSQELLYPLSKDSCYTFNIMINHSPNDAYSPHSRTAVLRIWGSNNPSIDCGREELLWVSPIPYTNSWRLCNVQFSPSKTYNHIILEAFYPDVSTSIVGHILIDQISNFKAFPKYVGFNLGEDITVCRGEETTLDVRLPPSQANYSIKWSTWETSSKITVKEPGIYWAEVKGSCGIFRDSIEIKHEKCIFIPNAFTPNGDGKNETFYIKGINKGNWQLKIYDRRGKLIYENNAYKNDWKGDGLPTTLYYYRLTNEDAKEDYKGWIQIMK